MGNICSSHRLTAIQKLSGIIQKQGRLMFYTTLNAQKTEAKSFGFFMVQDESIFIKHVAGLWCGRRFVFMLCLLIAIIQSMVKSQVRRFLFLYDDAVSSSDLCN